MAEKLIIPARVQLLNLGDFPRFFPAIGVGAYYQYSVCDIEFIGN